MSNAGAALMAVRMRRERQIIAALREHAALSQATATPLRRPDGLGRAALRSLIRNGAVTEVGTGSYYLDEAAYDAMRSKRRLRMGVMLLIVLAAAVVALVFSAANP
jgi:hypothetical protein